MTVFSRINRRAVRWDQLADNGMLVPSTASGKSIDEKEALKYGVVWASATLIADAVSYLTPEAFVIDPTTSQVSKSPLPRWIESPHPELRRGEVWNQLLLSALLWGNGYGLLIRRDSDGVIVGMLVLKPNDVTCEWDPNKKGYRRYKVAGSNKWLSSGDILHIMGPAMPGCATGMSVIAQAREAIGLGMTLEEFGARYFSQGSMAKVVIKVPGKQLTEQQARDLVQTYERFHRGRGNWHRPAVLSGPAGTDIENISIPPEDAQFLQSREFQAIDVARWFRVPPHRVGIISKQSSWGSGLAEENTAMVQHTFRPWIRRLEDVFTQYSPGGEDRGLRIRLNDAELLRGTFKDQVEAWAAAVSGQIAVPNEARKALGLDPIEGGDQLVKPAAPPQQNGGQPDPNQQPPGQRMNTNHDRIGRFASKGTIGAGEAGMLNTELQDNGGFTYSTHDDKLVTSGYAVSPYPERSKIIPAADVQPDDLVAYSQANKDLLAKPDHMMGGWHNTEDGNVYLDVTVVKPNTLQGRVDAIKVAEDHNQIAIFHLDTFDEIPTGGTGRGQ